MGAATYGHAGSVYRSGNADYPALDSLMAKTDGVRVSAHVPAVSGNKQNSVIRLGMRRDMVQPMWNGVTLIVDEVTLSGKGEIEVTADLAVSQRKLSAPKAFWKQQAQHCVRAVSKSVSLGE